VDPPSGYSTAGDRTGTERRLQCSQRTEGASFFDSTNQGENDLNGFAFDYSMRKVVGG